MFPRVSFRAYGPVASGRPRTGAALRADSRHARRAISSSSCPTTQDWTESRRVGASWHPHLLHQAPVGARASCFQHGGRDIGVVLRQHWYAEPVFLLHRRGSVTTDSPLAGSRTNPRTAWRDELNDASTSDPAAKRGSCSHDTGTRLSTDRGTDFGQPCSSDDR